MPSTIKDNLVKISRCVLVHGDPSGWRLYFLDFDLRVPLCCLHAMPILPDLQLPKQNKADIITRVANDHDRDQIFGLDYQNPTDSNRFQPIIGTINTDRSTTPTRILKSIMISESSNRPGRRSLASLEAGLCTSSTFWEL